MVRTLLVSFGLLLSTVASAAPLGLAGDRIPEAPESRRPGESHRERKAEILRGEVPEILVPYRYLRNGRIGGSRFYTEEGEVLRIREVTLVLDASESSADAMTEYHRHRRAAAGWSLASLALTPLMPLNLIPLIGAYPHSAHAQSSFEEAVAAYNAPADTAVAR